MRLKQVTSLALLSIWLAMNYKNLNYEIETQVNLQKWLNPMSYYEL